jgi:ferritin
MISESMNKILNEQIQAELHSGYLYLGLCVDFEKMGLEGFAHWLKCQWREEQNHAMRIGKYVLSHENGEVILKDIVATDVKWETPLDAFRATLDHEKLITNRIQTILKTAREEGDYGCENLMAWFIDEQVEEESVLSQCIKQLEMVGDDNNGIIFLDKKLGERKYEHENPC